MESPLHSRQSRPLFVFLSPFVSPLMSDDVSLLSLSFSSHQPPSTPACPPHHSHPLPTHLHLPSSLETLHHCHPLLYFTGQQPSTPHTDTRAHTHTHTNVCTSLSYSHARPKIILLFLLQSFSLTPSHAECPSLSLSVNVVERLDSLWDAWTHPSLWAQTGMCYVTSSSNTLLHLCICTSAQVFAFYQNYVQCVKLHYHTFVCTCYKVVSLFRLVCFILSVISHKDQHGCIHKPVRGRPPSTNMLALWIRCKNTIRLFECYSVIPNIPVTHPHPASTIWMLTRAHKMHRLHHHLSKQS